jgi:hypothetical protein
MKKILLLTLITFLTIKISVGQQNYCDFEGIKYFNFGFATGTLDTLVTNPYPNSVDSSAFCAMYIRKDTATYDFFKLTMHEKLIDVTPYASGSPIGVPKITMKLYSSAPANTVIQLQLGSKNIDNYPAGIHSEYTAMTSAQNAWQDITFNYFQSPSGSLVEPTNVDKVVILFNPGFKVSDTIYFDDLMGPELASVGNGISDVQVSSFDLFQNQPNPVKEKTQINFELNSHGSVTLDLYDLLGNKITSLINQNLIAGNYSVPVETENVSNGIYFYTLKKDGISKSMKMIISK